jgi:DNA-binding CsgD family transcriptional regulator
MEVTMSTMSLEIIPHLTARELDCLRWIALGKDTTEIAVLLNISSHTARDHLKSVRQKLGCTTTAQAVTKAVCLGLLVLEGYTCIWPSCRIGQSERWSGG